MYYRCNVVHQQLCPENQWQGVCMVKMTQYNTLDFSQYFYTFLAS